MAAGEVLRKAKSTPRIVVAAGRGELARIKSLVKQGAKVDRTAHDGVTALMSAAYAGHTPVLEYLLAKGASPFAKEESGHTSMGNAVFAGDCMALDLLLRYASKEPSENPTLLVIAATYGHAAVTHSLLMAGADVNGSLHGIQPIWAALSSQSKKLPYPRFEPDRLGVFRHLLEFGADVHQKNAEGLTLEEYAQKNYPEVLTLLRVASDRKFLTGHSLSALNSLAPSRRRAL
jgi:ankyrin repeat protein